MAWLPDTDDRTVRLRLVDISPVDPHGLGGCHDGLLDDNRLLNHGRLLNHDGLLDDNRLLDHGRLLDHDRFPRRNDRPGNGTADDTADETRPEIAPPGAPAVMMVMMMMWMPVMMRIGKSTNPHQCKAQEQNDFSFHFDSFPRLLAFTDI